MAAFAILLFMGINLRGVKETGSIQNVIVSFKLMVLLFVALMGLFFISVSLMTGAEIETFREGYVAIVGLLFQLVIIFIPVGIVLDIISTIRLNKLKRKLLNG